MGLQLLDIHDVGASVANLYVHAGRACTSAGNAAINALEHGMTAKKDIEKPHYHLHPK